MGQHRQQRNSGSGEDTLFGLPITASSCLLCSGNEDTVAVKANAAAMVLVKCIISMGFVYDVKDVE